MPKYTKGPWKVDATWGLIMAGTAEIAACHAGRGEDSKANAALIATAPELYALLNEINAAFYTRTTRKKWIEIMDKTKPLLQKARGEK